MKEKEYFKILLAEDVKDYREGIGASLSWAFNKYNQEKPRARVETNIVMVDSAEGAMQEMCTDPDIKLLITDLKFPKTRMDGLTLVANVSNLQLDERIGIIVQTAYPCRESLRKSMHFGVFDYLEKPFAVEVLIETVKEYIRLRYRRFAIKVESRPIFDKEKATTYGPYTYVNYQNEDNDRKSFSLGLTKQVTGTVFDDSLLPEEEEEEKKPNSRSKKK